MMGLQSSVEDLKSSCVGKDESGRVRVVEISRRNLTFECTSTTVAIESKAQSDLLYAGYPVVSRELGSAHDTTYAVH